MKIVHLIDYFQPAIGYQETFLSKEYIKLGHDVTVVTSDRYYPFPNYSKTFSHILSSRYVGHGWSKEEGISVIRLPSFEIPGTPLIWLRGLASCLSTIHPDVVLCHGVYSLTSYHVAHIHQKKDWRLFYDSHAASFNTSLHATYLKEIYYQLYQLCMVSTIRSSMDGVFAVGDEEALFLKDQIRLIDTKAPIIRLGVDTERFSRNLHKRKKIRSQMNIPDNAIVIVNAGKMGKEKDIPILLRAIEMLDDQDMWLLLIGDGSNEVSDQISNHSKKHPRTIHISYVPNEELPSYFSASDIGVWPGNFTMTILEAMSCSLPVILAEQSSTNYLHECDGLYWFTRGEHAQLSSILLNLLHSTRLRSKKGKENCQYIETYLSWENIAKQTLSVFS